MTTYRVALDIDRDEYLRVYRGTARSVLAVTTDGQTLQFPVKLLQKFVMQNGVHGEFLIKVDANNKFQSITKVK